MTIFWLCTFETISESFVNSTTEVTENLEVILDVLQLTKVMKNLLKGWDRPVKCEVDEKFVEIYFRSFLCEAER